MIRPVPFTYAEYRAKVIAGEWKHRPGMQVLNNTGNSRQVRRKRERDREGPIRLSLDLRNKLDALEDGQGLFMRLRLGYRSYSRGYTHDRREPREDYSKRYQALFDVLPAASVHP